MDNLSKAREIIKELLDHLSHAPDSSKQWYEAIGETIDNLNKAKEIIKELLDAAEYIEEGGCLDSLSHAPDSGEQWHKAIAKAKEYLGNDRT